VGLTLADRRPIDDLYVRCRYAIDSLGFDGKTGIRTASRARV
jgi:hypothetical protein